MSLAEFLENYQVADDAPYNEVWVSGEESPTGDHGFFCSHCGADVTVEICPMHAPMEFPGLRLAECSATPTHVMFGHERDDYGLPCPWCQINDLDKQLQEARQCRHRPWRRWKLVYWIVRLLSHVGLTGYGVKWGDGCDNCLLTDGMRFSRQGGAR